MSNAGKDSWKGREASAQNYVATRRTDFAEKFGSVIAADVTKRLTHAYEAGWRDAEEWHADVIENAVDAREEGYENGLKDAQRQCLTNVGMKLRDAIDDAVRDATAKVLKEFDA